MALRTYFVYLLDRNGHIVIRREVDADDDDTALVLAREILAAHPSYPAAEVWDLDRKLATLTLGAKS